jgi:DNA transformation protein
MAVSQDYLDFILDQLSGVEGIEPKKMFGGIGFFKEGIMFGMIGGGIFRLRVDETNEKEYKDAGMKNFAPKAGSKGMPYYEVPESVLNDKMELTKWANKAYRVAVAHKK